jgi:hypothetical protein
MLQKEFYLLSPPLVSTINLHDSNDTGLLENFEAIEVETFWFLDNGSTKSFEGSVEFSK